MVHPSSHKDPNEINRAVFILGEIWICLDFFLRPNRWNVGMCKDSIVIPYGSLAVVLFDIITGGIVLVACFLGVYSHLNLLLLACCYLEYYVGY